MSGRLLESKTVATQSWEPDASVTVQRQQQLSRLDRKDFPTSQVVAARDVLRIETPDDALEVKLRSWVTKRLPPWWPTIFDEFQIELLAEQVYLDYQFLVELAKAGNPHVPQVLSEWSDGFAMSQVEGIDGAHYVWATLAELWQVLEETVRVVVRTYHDGVLHLDLSGRNVMINLDASHGKQVQLIDFGMALPITAGRVTIDSSWLAVKGAFPPEVINYFAKVRRQRMELSAWDFLAFELGETIGILSCRYNQSLTVPNGRGYDNRYTVYSQGEFERKFQRYAKIQHPGLDLRSEAVQKTHQYLSQLLRSLLSPSLLDRLSPEDLLDFVKAAHQDVRQSVGDLVQSTKQQPASDRDAVIRRYEDGPILIPELLIDTIHKTLLDEGAHEKATSETMAFQSQNAGGSHSGGDGLARRVDTA